MPNKNISNNERIIRNGNKTPTDKIPGYFKEDSISNVVIKKI